MPSASSSALVLAIRSLSHTVPAETASSTSSAMAQKAASSRPQTVRRGAAVSAGAEEGPGRSALIRGGQQTQLLGLDDGLQLGTDTQLGVQ